MNEKEKIKKIYSKHGIKVDEASLKNIIKDENRVKAFTKIYKQEEIESMNYILGKPYNNYTFTKFELEAMSKINLFDKKVVNICKIIWDNKDNEEKLQEFLNQIKKEVKV